MSNIGRRSVFSKEQQDFFAASKNFEERITFQAIVVDVCDFSQPKSRFLDQEFPEGITLLVIPYEDCQLYPVLWDESESSLISDEGTKDNIIGREVTICCKSRKETDVYKGKVTFNGQKFRQVQNNSAPGYRSTSFSASMYTNHESQMENNKPRISGAGEIPAFIGKG
jgi:hypothetical protein